jgi:hypothetical protein
MIRLQVVDLPDVCLASRRQSGSPDVANAVVGEGVGQQGGGILAGDCLDALDSGEALLGERRGDTPSGAETVLSMARRVSGG